MDVAEMTLLDLGVTPDRIHIERFVSPPDSEQGSSGVPVPDAEAEAAPESITIVLDGGTHEVPYESGDRVLAAVKRAGLDPPFSCEEGYCSACMAKLKSGRVVMAANDCLSPELLEQTIIPRSIGPSRYPPSSFSEAYR